MRPIASAVKPLRVASRAQLEARSCFRRTGTFGFSFRRCTMVDCNFVKTGRDIHVSVYVQFIYQGAVLQLPLVLLHWWKEVVGK